MTLQAYVDGIDRAFDIRIGDMGLAYGADATAHVGHIVIDDPDGDIEIVGHRRIRVIETACTFRPRQWNGYMGPRDYERGTYRDATGRFINCDILDSNAALGFRSYYHAADKRPAESVSARLTWVLGTDELAPFLGSSPDIDISGTRLARPMDETDYRDRYPVDVMNDIISAAEENGTFYLEWDEANDVDQLHIGPYLSTTRSSTLKLSNVLDDQDDPWDPSAVTFAPFVDAKLNRDPSDVFSYLRLVYKTGVYWHHLQATEDAYIRRGTSLDIQTISSPTTAAIYSDGWLRRHSIEADTITCTVQLPAEHVGKIDIGEKIQAKFSHLATEGYGAFTDMMVAAKNITQPERSDLYNVELTLAGAGFSAGGGGGGGGGTGGFPTPPPVPCPDWDPDTGGTFSFSGVQGSYSFADDVNPTYYLNMDYNRRYHFTVATLATGGAPIPTIGGGISRPSAHVGGDNLFNWTDAGDSYGMRAEGLTATQLGQHPSGATPWTEHLASNDNSNTYADPPQDVYGGAVPGARDNGPMTFWALGENPPNPANTFQVTITVRVYDSSGTLLTCTSPDPIPPQPGQTVPWVVITGTPTGGQTNFTTLWPYATGSLQVKVDGVLISPASIVEDDPGAGTFHLTWQIDADETVTVTYQGA